MKTILILAAAIAMTGCALTPYDVMGNPASPRIMSECTYEATKATAGIASAVQAGWMQGDIERQCLALRGYRR